MFSLNDFDSHLPAQIKARGRIYFENGAVESLEQSGKGRWSSVVIGNADYEVEIRLAGRQVESWDCDCPYDGGPVCKHVVAVLYALREAQPNAAKKGGKSSKRFSFEDILLQLDVEELRAFFRHQKELHKDFEDQFLLFFADKNPNLDLEKKYRNIVRKLIRKHSDRGFMDYQNTFSLTKAMRPLVQTAHQALARNKFREALAIGQVVCVEVMDVLQNCDDSAGNVGGLIVDAILLIGEVAKSRNAAPELLEKVFEWLENQLLDRIWFDYGDFGHELLDAAEAMASRLDAERYLRLLDRLLQSEVAKGEYREYTRNAFQKRKIHFLQTIGREEEAEQLIIANMEIVEIRMEVVEQAIEQEDFSRARKLIAEGITIAQRKEHPGTVSHWEKVLLRVAELENDTESFRFLAKKFAFDRGLNQEYYAMWKASFTPAEWHEVVEAHIQSVIAEEKAKPRKYRWDNLDRTLFKELAPIYVEEKQWERLLQLIPPEPSEHILRYVHPHLSKRYPKEMLTIYLPALEEICARAGNRKQYRSLAQLMKKIKQDIAGSHTAIDELAAAFIARHPRRRAMKDEFRLILGVLP